MSYRASYYDLFYCIDYLYPAHFNKPFWNRISRCFSRNDTVVRITNTRTAEMVQEWRLFRVASCLHRVFFRMYSIRKFLALFEILPVFFISGDFEGGTEKYVRPNIRLYRIKERFLWIEKNTQLKIIIFIRLYIHTFNDFLFSFRVIM